MWHWTAALWALHLCGGAQAFSDLSPTVNDDRKMDRKRGAAATGERPAESGIPS